MNDIRFGENTHLNLLLAPVDIVSAATQSTHVKVTGHRVHFLVTIGAITGDSLNVQIEASTAATTTGANSIAFAYRLSGDTAADTYGAITTADSDGVDFTASDDNKFMLIDVDPSILPDDDNYLSVLLAPGASASVCLASVMVAQESRYGQLDPVSST